MEIKRFRKNVRTPHDEKTIRRIMGPKNELGTLVNTLTTTTGYTLYFSNDEGTGFLEREEDLRLYYIQKTRRYMMYKGGKIVFNERCPPPTINDVIKHSSRKTQVLLIHSAFCQMMKACRGTSKYKMARASYVAAGAAYAAEACIISATSDVVHVGAAAYMAYDNTTHAKKHAREAFRRVMRWRGVE